MRLNLIYTAEIEISEEENSKRKKSTEYLDSIKKEIDDMIFVGDGRTEASILTIGVKEDE